MEFSSIFCAALILFMQAGFALNESGFSRAKNSGTIMLRSLANISLGGLVFWAVGFGLMFGASNGLTGWSHFFLSPDSRPESQMLYAFWMQQSLCAVTAGAIVFGATAERMRFGASVMFSVLMALVIYPVSGHWAWGSLLISGNSDTSAWLAKREFIDFAGSAVVHCTGGFAALGAAMAVGPRLGKFGKDGSIRLIAGHNLTLSSLGVMILFVGWIGFTGVSATLRPDVSAGRVAMNTMLAGFAAASVSMVTAWVRFRKPDIGMTLNGALAGLVAISASCATVYPAFAVLIGGIAGALVVGSVLILDRAQVDDPAGAISVHGVCGAFGTIAAGVLHEGMFNGQRYDWIDRLSTQALGVAAIFVWSFGLTFAVLKAIDLVTGLRASAENEMAGLDMAELGTNAYAENFSSTSGPLRSGVSRPVEVKG
ncbi:MAG: ammonium transporter [Bryobacteraceae bacterium]|nr:ammonium transporter [Bryobacteraceae bacterium]